MKNLIIRASLFTRLWLSCLLATFLGSHAHAANTFSNASPLATVRSGSTATLLSNGKVLVAGGSNAGGHLGSAELYDPVANAWIATAGSFVTARSGHTATLLPSGKVLVVGGFNGVTLGSAELFNPVTGTWTATGSLATAREVHTATLLPDGKVLVAAGFNAGALASAEIYDPATGGWTSAASPLARYGHTATLLPTGKVLVAGGISAGNRLTTAELYDPGSNQWTSTGVLNIKRNLHTATLLPNGKVLVAGGQTNSTVFLTSSEIYDPGSGIWSATTGSLGNARYLHTATLLPNGKVLVAGGLTTGGAYLASAEIFDSAAGSWSLAGGPLGAARYLHTATILPGGKVLVVAGATTGGVRLGSAELFEPAVSTWSSTTALGSARGLHTATLLPNGKVLVVGGQVMSTFYTSAELYDPATGAWTTTGSLIALRSRHTATLLASGKVLVVGGTTGTSTTAELYDPATGQWSGAGTLASGRYSHTATLLANGKVLVLGGLNYNGQSECLGSAELYDPATGLWSGSASPGIPLTDHTATLLPDGKVLVAGGASADVGGQNYSSVFLYNPASDTWRSTAPSHLIKARSGHIATLLPDGKVLIAGGREWLGPPTNSFNYLSSAELYDPASGTWTAAAAMGAPSYGAAVGSLLPDGKVLVVGIFKAEVYDRLTGLWSRGSPDYTQRYYHTTTLMTDGRVLVAGGGPLNLSTALSNAELFDAGLGYSPVWQPQITSAAFDAGGRLVVTGTGFRGISSASGGNSGQDSPSNTPVVQLRRFSDQFPVFLHPDPTAAISATQFISGPVAPFLGSSLVTVFANGIPSVSRVAAAPTLSLTRDTDGDGLSDAAEFQLASLGFDFNVSQPELVNAMFSNLNTALPNLNAAGLYTPAQVQALHIGTPLIQKNATTGQFKLTIGLEKSTNLSVPNGFVPFPFTGPGTVINGQGEIEFLFTVPDNAAFFRLESH